jgi:hypothetical protein
MKQPGLDGSHRDKNGTIAQKHGNTLISTLRERHGAGFALGYPQTTTLSEILHELDEPSLRQLLGDEGEIDE